MLRERKLQFRRSAPLDPERCDPPRAIARRGFVGSPRGFAARAAGELLLGDI